ncbi:MAG: hypothetical protein ACKVZH_06920 [Blastocatellia bacterium]
MKRLKVYGAIVLFLIAGLLAVIEVFAFVDPAGTKMADDADPFGSPHIVTWPELAIVVAIITVLIWIAARLLRQANKQNLSSKQANLENK